MAVGSIREIRERGLRIPDDISVTGFDDIKLTQFDYPALTTVHIARDQIGQYICQIPIPNGKTKAGTGDPDDPELMLRDSTGRLLGREARAVEVTSNRFPPPGRSMPARSTT